MHVQDIQPSPEPEFIERPRCGQPVLKDNLSRQWNEWGQVCSCESCGSFEAGCHAFDEPVPAPISDLPRLPGTTQRILDTVEQIAGSLTEVPAPMSELERLPATTQRILHAVQQITQDLTEIPARVFTSRLEALIDDLVSNVVPLMAAEERVLCPDFDSHLADALRKDHNEVRRLIELLSMLAESLERRIASAVAKGPVRTTLRQMTSALRDLHIHQLDALRHLGETLPLNEQARLSARLDAAAIDARERTMLIVRPEIPPTASTVLRHRPDLTAAYAMSLAEIERQSRRRSWPAEKG